MSRWNDSLRALNKQYDICVLGEERVGKSSLIFFYTQHKFIEETDSSIEDLYTKIIQSGMSYNEITILDTSSNIDNYASSRKQQILNTSTIVFAYAINDRMSFEAVEDIFERIQNVRDELPPSVLVGLKSDLESERLVSYNEGQSLAERLGVLNFTECSSKLGVGIEETYQPLVDVVLASRQASSDSNKKKNLTQSANKSNSVRSLKNLLSNSQSNNSAVDENPEGAEIKPNLPNKASSNKQALSLNPSLVIQNQETVQCVPGPFNDVASAQERRSRGYNKEVEANLKIQKTSCCTIT